MNILVVILISGLVIGTAVLIWQIAPARSKLEVTNEEEKFPIVSGYNLNRQELEFPRDFGGDLNLVIIAFKQYQQAIVNTWIPFVQEMEAITPGFIYYELPTIYEMPALSRTFINEGMRAGIPDQTARERTITLYLNKEAFKSVLNINHENDIYIFLVKRDGNILWRTTGKYSEDKASEISQVINNHHQGE